MTNAEIDKIMNDDKWVKIYFMTRCGQGHLLIKNSLYEKKIRKIEKSLRGLISCIEYDYHLSLDEFMNFDPELNHLYKRKQYLQHEYQWYTERHKYDTANEYFKLNGENNQEIERRVKELRKEYEEKGGEN